MPPCARTHHPAAGNSHGRGTVDEDGRQPFDRGSQGETLMPKAYWINTFTAIRDPVKLAAYVRLAGPAMQAAGGRFLARGNPATAFESGTTTRTTLIELPDVAEREIRIIEAVE